MKKVSFPERCGSSENRDHMLTLSTQSQEDEHFQQISPYTDNQNLLFLLQEDDSTNRINTIATTSKQGLKTTTSTTKKEKFSLVLNEITRAASSRAKTTMLNSTATGVSEVDKNKQICQSNRWINEEEDYELRMKRLRKSSIVSIYCKQNDITFVSSPEEFALKVMDDCNKPEQEEDPHLSQLQIELIISNKDGGEESYSSQSSFKPSSVQKSNLSSKKEDEGMMKYQQLNKQTSLISELGKGNSILVDGEKNESEINNLDHDLIDDEDDDNEEYDFLISTRQSPSLQKAIHEHTQILKQYKAKQQYNKRKSLSQPSPKLTAQDLLLSLQIDIQKYY